MESALASGNQRHKECSVGFPCYGSHAVPNQQHLRQHGPLPSFPEWLPSHTACHLSPWHRPKKTLRRRAVTSQMSMQWSPGTLLPPSTRTFMLPWTQALQPHSTGRAPGQPLLESCPWSTRLRYMKIKHQPVQGLLGTLLGGSYKSCQHGLPQAFSFSSMPGVRRCLSFAPPPSIFSVKAFCVPTVFIDISASWPFQLCKSESPSSPFKVAPVPSHCP